MTGRPRYSEMCSYKRKLLINARVILPNRYAHTVLMCFRIAEGGGQAETHLFSLGQLRVDKLPIENAGTIGCRG